MRRSGNAVIGQFETSFSLVALVSTVYLCCHNAFLTEGYIAFSSFFCSSRVLYTLSSPNCEHQQGDKNHHLEFQIVLSCDVFQPMVRQVSEDSGQEAFRPIKTKQTKMAAFQCFGYFPRLLYMLGKDRRQLQSCERLGQSKRSQLAPSYSLFEGNRTNRIQYMLTFDFLCKILFLPIYW